MPKKRLLFCASEVYPFAKTGGLADVAYSLPRALKNDYDLQVILPLYQQIDRRKYAISPLGKPFSVEMGGTDYEIELYSCDYKGLNYIFIYSALLCDREFIYGAPEAGYADNALRFGLFSYAIKALLKQKYYDIVHLNDWQTALVALLLKEDSALQTRSIFTIHNLAYQGIFDASTLSLLGIDQKYFTQEGLEFYNQINFMKAGIAYADYITTVSPTYAKEILTQKFGCSLEGFLNVHKKRLFGILNGIDTQHFSPSSDEALTKSYSQISGKTANKKAYLDSVGLKGQKKPLFIFIGRFTWQKGMDLLIQSLDQFAELECNIAILGEGEREYHKAIKRIADQHKNIHLEFGYDESQSHKMYAAADFLLMPSHFEPCGLNQMIAMHYGTMPIVHEVGGLKDSVTTKRGIIFKKAEMNDFMQAIQSALKRFKSKKEFTEIGNKNMEIDFSWTKSAQAYIRLYTQSLVK